MNAGDIAFPNLGIYLKDVPKTFSIFGFEIAFYGLLIGIGVLAGILMAAHMAKVTGQNPDEYWDFAIYAVLFSIVGARIYYVVFAWDYYKDDLLGIGMGGWRFTAVSLRLLSPCLSTAGSKSGIPC